MKSKKVLSLILMLCMVFSACLSFSACNQDNAGEGKYAGETITFLTCGVNPTYESEILPNNYEEEGLKKVMPEALNADLQKRLDTVHSTLGVEIKEVKIYEPTRPQNEMYQTIVRSRASGTADYDVVVPCIYDAAMLAQESMFYDLNQIPELNLKAEWWNQEFNEQMTFYGQLYFTIGELGHVNKSNTAALYFNLDYWNKHKLTDTFGANPYDLVRQGKWTLDLVIEAAHTVPMIDTNSDGTIDYTDVFGWSGQDDDLWSLFYGTGERIAKVGEGQKPYISMYNSSSNAIIRKLQTFTFHDTYIRANDYFSETIPWPVEETRKAFTNDRCLFFNDVVGGIIVIGKEMNSHFGVVPVPKASALQDNYQSLINPWGATCYAIPAFVKKDRLPMIAETLDLMGEVSLETTSKSYAEILEYMKTRDDDSKEMLNEYILANRACDIGMVYRWGDLQGFLQDLGYKYKGSFRSEFLSRKKVANLALEKTIAFFKENATS